jgi:cellulose biosynthesis protein BcsQ
MAKIFAVYGSSGSYKTTTSLALAHYISKSEPSANVIVVGTDNTKPLIPIVAPNEKKFTGSLGRCLSDVSFEQKNLRENLLRITDHIFVLGYNIRENFNTFPQPDNDRLIQIFSYLNPDAQYIIVDCMPYVIGDKVTSFAIRNADRTIELFTCDLNGLVFDGSQEPILQSEQYKYRTFIRAVSLDSRFKQDVTAMKNALGRISGEIPYSTKAAEYFNQATILQNGVDDLTYNRAIKSLAKLLMGGKD